jgi:tetratricopeptide (TPR) repeat protein
MLRALVALLVLLAPAAFAKPRAITPAEKAASEAAADFLARGPAALYDRLAADAPFRLLDRAAALGEIAVRTGPREEALWQLRASDASFAKEGAVFHVFYPSGGEDVLVFRMRGEKILEIRSMVEPRSAPARSPLLPAKKAAASPPYAYAAAAAAVVLALLVRKRGPRLMWMLYALAAVIVGAQVLLTVTDEPRETKPAMPFAELRALQPLRRAMTLGDRDLPILKVQDRVAGEAALLWQLQATSAGARPAETRAALKKIRALHDAPLATLLRARLASADGKSDEASKLYHAFTETAPAHDAFWLEAELAAPTPEKSAWVVRRMEELGSRDAGVYYVRSVLFALESKNHDARNAFQQAWMYMPVARDELLSAGVFGMLLQDLSISAMVRVHQPEETIERHPSLSSNAMQLPNGARAIASGNYVRVEIGDARLDLPGGAELAPRDTEILPASEWRRREREDALARVPQLQESGFASAAAELLAETAAEALIADRKWSEVLALTESITPHTAEVSVALLKARIEALVRAERNEEARRLANGSAIDRAMKKREDPLLTIDIGALLAEAGAYNDAINFYTRASKMKGAPNVEWLIKQATLRRALATTPVAHQTQHFVLHHTPSVPVTVLERVGQLLELELARLTSRFPREPFLQTHVNIVTWEEFSSSITGSDHIAGIYDGDITIPFGEVERFREDVVAVLTHELMHAIVAQRSGDRVPRWLQEGIADHVELLERKPNVFQENRDHMPALELLEATMNHSWNAFDVVHAYTHAATFVRYLEEQYGADAVPRIVASFAAGGTTESALRDLTGKPLTALDRDFRTWGLTHAGTFVDNTPWPYGQYYSLGIDPKVRAGIRFSRRPR